MNFNEWTTRPRTVRVSVDATVTRPPGRGRYWTATSERWSANGPTEKAAGDALGAALQEFLRLYQDPTVLAFRGHVTVISLSLGDATNPVVWWHRMVRPDGSNHQSSYGDSWESAEISARYHLAQMSTDWHDDTSVHEAAEYLAGGEQFGYGQYGPEELYRYAAWQRAARHAINAGMGDEFHEWASQHQSEFTVPRPAVEAAVPVR